MGLQNGAGSYGLGVRQRLGKRTQQPGERTAAHLARQYATGVTAASSAVRLARIVADDFRNTSGELHHENLENIVKGSASSSGHEPRKLRSTLRKTYGNRGLRPYYTGAPLWDPKLGKKTIGRVAVLPPHETLAACVQDGDIDSWCSLGAGQANYGDELEQWGDRVGLDV